MEALYLELKDLETGKKFQGLVFNQIVEIVATKFYNNDAVEITYKTEQGKFGTRIIYAEELSNLNLVEILSTWKFTADSKIFKLTMEAYRINSAHLFEPYMAVYSSFIEPLPHQISAVYERMLPQNPLRFVLADDPGAGKTIMAGLLIKELILRSDVKRCLIVCPKVLSEQWQDELQQKFQLEFEILSGERITSAGENVFAKINFCIASIDTLARHEDFQKKLKAKEWDLIICDEAHKMAATFSGKKIKYTKRFKLGKVLGKIARHFLLLTATPHNGKEKDFYLFMSLIDPDRFEGVSRISGKLDVSDILRRLVKEDLLTFKGKPLFPERIAYTVNYSLSLQEIDLYESVTAYVVDGFNRAEKLSGDKRTSVGFAMTILQRRLASSPCAIFKSLQRRTERLKKILYDKKFHPNEKIFDAEDFEDAEDFFDAEFEDAVAEKVTPARTVAELQIEIQTLEKLTEKANKVFYSGEDRKWLELSQLLHDKIFSDNSNEREKLIIFTEHKDTLEYLQQKISQLFGRANIVVAIHGGLNFKTRRNIEEQFKQDKNILILVATDAAGEGINLQNAHLMINYDLPWNPNRLEQRFGRIHRIGQKKICYLWNLVANETREGQVFNRLLQKLENERAALGGKVFDILGKISFDNKPLKDLLIEAVKYGNDAAVIRRMDNVIDKSFNPDKLRELLRERALTQDILNAAKVADINLDMERNEIFKLQPYFIEDFFINALRKFGGQIDKIPNGRYEISNIPPNLRTDTLPESYERICFSKDKCNIKGLPPATLISLEHPLLKNLTNAILKKFGESLRQGTIFIDDNAQAQNLRLLFFIETAIQDGRNEFISKRLQFVEIFDDGNAVLLNHAPYFDYRPPAENELKKILAAVQNSLWLKDVESIAVNFAVKNIIPAHLKEIFADKKAYLDKLETAVKSRLLTEITYCDREAHKFKDKDKIKSEKFTQRADELENRLRQRLNEIKLEREIFAAAPVIVGDALIVPRGYTGENTFSFNVDARSKIEKIAMQAVMKIEKSLGNFPVDCSAKKCGYDIESVAPDKNFVRFIEVKGRTADADTVTVTTNEIVTALNAPENFILAVVKVDGNSVNVVYLKKTFSWQPDLASESSNYQISTLRRISEIILEKNFTLQD